MAALRYFVAVLLLWACDETDRTRNVNLGMEAISACAKGGQGQEHPYLTWLTVMDQSWIVRRHEG